jgi:hypothetical protein
MLNLLTTKSGCVSDRIRAAGEQVSLPALPTGNVRQRRLSLLLVIGLGVLVLRPFPVTAETWFLRLLGYTLTAGEERLVLADGKVSQGERLVLDTFW